MKLCKSVLVASLATAAALVHVSNAWTISSSPAAAPPTSLGDHQELAKTWTVSGDVALTTLELGAIGRVFVDYDSSLGAGTVAKIVVSGNSSALLDVVDVVNDDENASAVKLQLADKDLKDKGYLLTQVYISGKQSIESVSLVGSGDVIVGNDVLVQSNSSASVALGITGSGDLYAGSDSTSFDLQSVAVGVVGSGDLQLVAKTLKLNSTLAVGIAGSGDVAVVAEEITVKDTVVAGVAGSGDVYVQTDKLTAFNLSTNIAGSGDVTYSRAGSVQQQTVVVAGSGDVAAGSIVAVDTNVTILGSGDVVVQTSGKLDVTAQFSGEARYYGVTPSSITSKSLFGKKKKVKEAKKNHYDEYEVDSVPPRKPLFTVIEVEASSVFSSKPQIKFLIEADNENDIFYHSGWNFDAQTQSFAAQTIRQAPGVVVFAFVGLAFAAVGVAARKYKTRMEREKYAPLV